MNVTSVSHFRSNLKKYIKGVDQDQEPLIVSGPDNVSVVVIPLATYNSYMETDYLLSSPANAKRLRDSIAELDAGKGQKHELIED
jgi:antitoxin YefM